MWGQPEVPLGALEQPLFHTHKKPKVTGAFGFAENVADHKLWPKVFITLISPEGCS